MIYRQDMNEPIQNNAKAGARGVKIVALSISLIKFSLLFSNIVGSLYF